MSSVPSIVPNDQMRKAAALTQMSRYTPPYPWDIPPPMHTARHIMGSKVAPNYGISNQVLILKYQVPSSKRFVVKGIMTRYDGNNFVQGSGDVVFSIDINNPNTYGQGFTQSVGRTLPDYGQILFNLGSFDDGCFPIPGAPIIQPNDVLTIKGYTVQNVATGGDNRLNAMVIGWEWSEDAAINPASKY